ncbi:MAG TPA: MFS transporter [Chloroflexota bacterium]
MAATLDRVQPDTRHALTLALASLGFVSLGLPEGMLGVAWPSIRASFHLPLEALGVLIASFAAGYFVSSAVSGRVIGRLGIGTLLAVSCGLTGTCLIGYALAPSWSTMVALAAFLGVGAGTIDSGLNTYAAVAHGPRTLNWMHAAFGLGAAVGPLIMTAILSSGLAWNAGYAVVAVAQLGLAAGYWLTRRQFAGRAADHRVRAEPRLPSRSSSSLLRSPLLWLGLALFFVYCGMEAGTGQWSFSLFTLSREMPAALAGALVSAYWASLTLGRVVFGALVPKISSERLLRGCMLLCILAAGLLWANIPVVSWLALAVMGLAFAPIFPILIAETPARLGHAQAANAIGLQVAAAVAGGAALPALLGVLAARVSLEVLCPALFVAGVAQLVLHEVLTRRTPAAALVR